MLGWSRERTRSEMLGEKTVSVAVPVRFPVLVLYSTAMVGEDGAVQFFEDVYGEDDALDRALEHVRAQHFRVSNSQAPQDSRLFGTAFGLH